MPVITLPDGSEKTYSDAVTIDQVVSEIGPGLHKASLAAVVNDRLVDLSRQIDVDA